MTSSCLWERAEILLDRVSSREEATRYGAKLGFGVGLGCSAVELGLMRFVPSKFKAPLALAAILTPAVSTLAGGTIYDIRHNLTDRAHSQERMRRAEAINDDYADGIALSSKLLYDSLCAERIDKIVSSVDRTVDLNNNGFVDKRELSFALQINTPEHTYKRFLEQNYASLELLSRRVTNNVEQGVGANAMMLLTNRNREREFYFEEAQQIARERNYAVLKQSLLNNSIQGGCIAGTLALGARFLPASVRLRCYAGAAAIGVASSLVPSFIETMNDAYRSDELLRNQREALEKVQRGLRSQY